MVKELETGFLTEDKKQFSTKEEAFAHEKEALTKYVTVSYNPDLENLGKYRDKAVIKVINGRNYTTSIARDCCYDLLGPYVIYDAEGIPFYSWRMMMVFNEYTYLLAYGKENREILATIDLSDSIKHELKNQD